MSAHFRAVAVAVVGSAISILAGCGSQREALVSINISPATGTATHGSAKDTVQFTANGNFGTFGSYENSTATGTCLLHASDKTRTLTEVNWTTSDSVNSSVDANGVATCLGTTAAPATVTAEASGICGGIKATATLSCN
jgi:hypothetical protein